MKAADQQNQNAANTPAAMAELFSVPYFGKVPMDPNMMYACENGFSFLEKFPNSPASGPFSAIVDKLIASTERNSVV
jgi:Flp pilus assembly CpaE family ATPase